MQEISLSSWQVPKISWGTSYEVIKQQGSPSFIQSKLTFKDSIGWLVFMTMWIQPEIFHQDIINC